MSNSARIEADGLTSVGMSQTSPPKSGFKRPQPIRDAILAYLSEPRSARAIADHINRPVPTATGHLAAMRRRLLVIRLGYAAYARADYVGSPVEFRRSKSAIDRREVGAPAPDHVNSTGRGENRVGGASLVPHQQHAAHPAVSTAE